MLWVAGGMPTQQPQRGFSYQLGTQSRERDTGQKGNCALKGRLMHGPRTIIPTRITRHARSRIFSGTSESIAARLSHKLTPHKNEASFQDANLLGSNPGTSSRATMNRPFGTLFVQRLTWIYER